MNPTIYGDAAGGYRIEGSIIFETVSGLLSTAIDFSQSTSVNLEGVDRMDSAGVALLLEWSRNAKSNNAELVLEKVPVKAQSLLEVNGLQDILVTR